MAELVSEPDFYYRKSLWSDEPMMYLAAMDPEENSEWADIEPHWNWEDYQGQEIEVVAYSNVESVELFLDDKSLGTRNLSETDYHALRWNIPYETGTLRAVAQNDGKEVATYEMTTAGEPYQIQLNPNRSKLVQTARISPVSEYWLLIEMELLHPDADDKINFEIQGAGENIGVGNSNHNSLEPYKADYRKVYWKGPNCNSIKW